MCIILKFYFPKYQLDTIFLPDNILKLKIEAVKLLKKAMTQQKFYS